MFRYGGLCHLGPFDAPEQPKGSKGQGQFCQRPCGRLRRFRHRSEFLEAKRANLLDLLRHRREAAAEGQVVQPHLIRRLQVDQGLNGVVLLLLPRPATARTSILALRLLLLLRPGRFRSPDGTRNHPWQPRAGGVGLTLVLCHASVSPTDSQLPNRTGKTLSTCGLSDGLVALHGDIVRTGAHPTGIVPRLHP